MSTKRKLPENIRQTIDLISAVIRRMHDKALDSNQNKSLYRRNLTERIAT